MGGYYIKFFSLKLKNPVLTTIMNVIYLLVNFLAGVYIVSYFNFPRFLSLFSYPFLLYCPSPYLLNVPACGRWKISPSILLGKGTAYQV